jgi:hypothetical protein
MALLEQQMIYSLSDLASMSEDQLRVIPFGPLNRIKQALLLRGDREASASSFLVPGAEVTISELQEKLVAHHTVYWPQRDFRVLRSRRRSVDYACASELLNSSLKKRKCSFFARARRSQSAPPTVVIGDFCGDHSCTAEEISLNRNGRRKSSKTVFIGD